MPRKVIRAVLLLAGAVLTLVLTAATVPAATPGGKLSKEEAAALAKAAAKGDKEITLLIAARTGQTKSVIDGLEALGAKVRYRDDQLGYIRADVPTDKVKEALAIGGIEASEIDQVIPLPDPRPQAGGFAVANTAPGASTPRSNPYLPIRDTGAASWLDVHPTWDGRGVTIGIVDLGVSLDHPSLLTTSTGERKVIDWVTGTDPVTDNDPTWINMAAEVSGTTFSFGTPAQTYTAPAAGTYRIGLFNERDTRLGGEVGNDVNRDGNPAGSSGIFAVLWNATTGQVWVDTNQNRSFADQSAMKDYALNFDVSYFGTDNPATAIAERMPFVVQTDGQLKYVNIGIVSGAHGSHVAGIAAGNSLFGGAMSGAAPGAKIVSSRACLFVAGCTGHALVEGMIYVAKQKNVDVINMSIGGLPALNDGNNTRCVLYDRLIKQSNVQMFLSIGNSGPGLNTAGDPGLCGTVMGMGSYITSDTYHQDYGTPMPFADNLHLFSSVGPREDGGFKPSLVAPGAAISSIPMWQQIAGIGYTLPPGYTLMNGTSMASPQGAGVGALLVSAAKQAGVQHQPDQIRQALMSSARYLTEGRGYQAAEQGAGLVNVNAAWELLKTNLGPVTITSSVPVHTALSGFLATAGRGVGIYDREGVTQDQPYSRTYTFTREDGPGGSANYNVSWLGNDGTFSSPTSISLGRGAATPFVVNINPSSPGMHSAILRLDDPTTTGIDYQTMNTVIVPYDLNAGNAYTADIDSTIARQGVKRYYVRIPAGAPAFKVDFSGPSTTAGTGQARFLRWTPWGLGIDSNAVSNCYLPPQGTPATACNTGSFAPAGQDPASRTVTNPMPGVWEVTVDARRTSDNAEGAPFNLKMSILGASVSPNPDEIASVQLNVPTARSYTLTNLFGAFTGRAVGTNLGSARLGPFTINHLQQQEYPIAVPTGATSLRATIGSPGDPAADLDLFLFNCTSGTCVLAAQSADGDSEESVTVANPAVGNWKVMVDGFNVPAGSTSYKYVDVFFKGSSIGTIAVTDANALRASGASWIVPAQITANEAPATGRKLLGNVEVRTDTNVLVGSGDVIISSVTP
jgi:hypothetical protein